MKIVRKKKADGSIKRKKMKRSKKMPGRKKVEGHFTSAISLNTKREKTERYF